MPQFGRFLQVFELIGLRTLNYKSLMVIFICWDIVLAKEGCRLQISTSRFVTFAYIY